MTIRKHWPTISWALFILILSGIPGNQIPKIPTFLDWLSPDKMLHLVIFGILSYLILNGYNQQYLKSKYRSYIVIIVILVSTLYGLIMELLQLYIFICRSPSVNDFYANTLGACIGGMAYFLQHAKNKV